MASSPASPFSLDRESAGDGSFERQPSRFRDWVAPQDFEPGRYLLYVSHACPWAHRAIIVRRLKGLEDALPMYLVDPYRDERGWAFTGGEYTDPVNGWSFLGEGYAATDPGFRGRFSVPVLWDTQDDRIVNNESGDVVRMLNTWSDDGPDLFPAPYRDEIERLNERIYATVNNGVYRAGFATTQAAYEAAVYPLFESLDWLEDLLGDRRWLAGSPEPTEADWRLFTTLLRFDAVYHVHFRCNLRRLVDLPNLWAYARSLYQDFGIADTVRVDEFKRHYYTTHPHINPSRIIPAGPVVDWTEPHGRS